jgi:hypothetical protein
MLLVFKTQVFTFELIFRRSKKKFRAFSGETVCLHKILYLWTRPYVVLRTKTVLKVSIPLFEWMDGCMDRWMDGFMDGRVDGRVDGWTGG